MREGRKQDKNCGISAISRVPRMKRKEIRKAKEKDRDKVRNNY